MTKYYIRLWNDYPYQGIIDQNGKDVEDILLLTAPMYKHEMTQQDKFWKAKEDRKLCIGIMSCGHWPLYNENDAHVNGRLAQIKYPEIQAIIQAMDGWLYCSRTPPFPNVPHLLLSESDMTIPISPITKIWKERPVDIVFYEGLSDSAYYHYHKQVPQAIRILQYIKQKTGCRIVIVGPKEYQGFEHVPKMLWHEWCKYLETCKIILTTAVSDASPRTITDALNRGCAILVNETIVGGWKYVSPETGAFYNPLKDCESALEAYYKIIEADKAGILQPQQHFYSNFGREKMGGELYKFIDELRIKKKM
jgi:hypothetical protein